jgi:predicted metalloprotease with PDZ domain
VKKTRAHYTIRLPDPKSHLIEVDLSVADADEGGVILRMPVWTPGSYLVREFSRNVVSVTARRVEGAPVPVTKLEKNAWRVDAKPGKRVLITYTVYANELTVRTNHVDADHAFLHPAATFLYVEGREAEPAHVTIETPEGWDVATPLPLVSENTFEADDLDTLMDSPFELGTHGLLSFEAAGIPHRIALFGEGNFDPTELLADTHTICETVAGMFPGEHPCRAYTFIFHVLEGAGGGLEHKDCSVCGFAPHSFTPERGYARQLSLIAHEYFHLYNVKRIRPRELGPFDYDRENYTRLLWVAEGFTTYYQDRLLVRAGLMPMPDYLDDLARMIRAYREIPGRNVDPVAEASFDAWIKLYRPNENSRNTTISYYLKGAMVALLLDLAIREATGAEKSLDDVMADLWKLYRVRPDEGFTEEELLEIIEEVCGRDLSPELGAWVHSTAELPFEEWFAKVGLELVAREGGDPKAYLGITTKEANGKLTVSEVLADSPARAAGLNAGDELIFLDDWRLGSLPERLAERKPGEVVEFTISRRSRLRKIPVTLGEAPLTDVVLRPLPAAGESEEQLFTAWTGEPLARAAESPRKPPKDVRPRPF